MHFYLTTEWVRISDTNICFITYDYSNPETTFDNMWMHEEKAIRTHRIEMIAKLVCDVIRRAIAVCATRSPVVVTRQTTHVKDCLRSLKRVIFVGFCYGAPIAAQSSRYLTYFFKGQKILKLIGMKKKTISLHELNVIMY